MNAKIDWEEVERKLGISENGDEEAIVHELAHAYDCIGQKAFKWCGKQKEIGNLVREKYATLSGRDNAEIRVSVVTHFVLHQLNLADKAAGIVSDMVGNLQWIDRDDGRDKFEASIEKPSRTVQTQVRAITKFLSTFKTT